MARRVLLLDGHPDAGRLVTHLLDLYAAALPPGVELDRIALRDIAFDPVLHRGYAEVQALEPGLEAAWQRLLAADHLVIGFPLWWGAEPALLSGFWQRVLLPGRAFQDREGSLLWDRLLIGRTAELIVTMDTPPLVQRVAFCDPLGRRYRRQILGFTGIRLVRRHYFGRVAGGGAEAHLPRWTARLASAARRLA